MADEHEDATPSLEPPRLFGRRRKDPADPAPAADRASGDTRVFADTEAGLVDAGFVDAGVDVPAEPQPQPAAAPTRARRAVRVRRTPLAVPARLGAPLAGLATGAALLVLLWVAREGCELARGNEACGAGSGLTLLVVVFALTVVLGRLLLTRLGVSEPGMISFLAVGVTSVIAILLLEGLFDSPVIVGVVPLLSAAAFAGSAWVGTLQVSPDD